MKSCCNNYALPIDNIKKPFCLQYRCECVKYSSKNILHYSAHYIDQTNIENFGNLDQYNVTVCDQCDIHVRYQKKPDEQHNAHFMKQQIFRVTYSLFGVTYLLKLQLETEEKYKTIIILTNKINREETVK